ncbi:MAG: hypothetical protein ACREQ9_15795 [Candidatus Binatia bacterium]
MVADTSMPLHGPAPRAVAAACLLLVLGVELHQLSLLDTRRFSPDELQHVQAGWVTHEGSMPYRDYFDPHMPLFRLALAPWFRLFDAGRSGDEAVAFLGFARRAMWFVTAVILALTFRLGCLWRGATVGWVALVLLAFTSFFRDKTIEIRPDVPALACWLACLVIALPALRPSVPHFRRRFFAAGFFFGLSLSFNLKMLLALPAIGAVALPGARSAEERAAGLLAFAVGLSLPLLLLCAGFLAQGALDDLLHQTIYVSIFDWRHRFPLERVLGAFAHENPFIAPATAGGLVLAGYRVARRPAPEESLLVASALVPVAALLVMPEPWPQYFLVFLPLLAILAAGLVVEVVARLPPLALLALLVVIIAPSALPTPRARSRNVFQLREIRYVVEQTPAEATVLHGWGGGAPFRRPAYYVPFLSHGFSARLTPDDRAAMLRALESCRIEPDVVFFDRYVRSLSPEVEAYLEAHYQPAGVGELWKRKSACDPRHP